MYGFHVSREWVRGGIAAHVAGARAFYETCVPAPTTPFAFQVFVAGPRGVKFVTDPEEARELRERIRDLNAAGKPTWGVAHGTYLDIPWAPDKPNHKWTVKWISSELARAAAAGLAGLVIHLTSAAPERVLEVLPKLLEPPADAEWVPGTRLYLEVPAVLPAKSRYATPEQLVALFTEIRRLADPALEKVGLCIDTAHIWASGADISSYELAADWIARLEAQHAVIPPAAMLLHLNDNFNPRGSGKDEHAPFMHGAIWGAYVGAPEESGFAAFIDYARRHRIPVVCERKAFAGGGLTLRQTLASDLAAIGAVAGYASN